MHIGDAGKAEILIKLDCQSNQKRKDKPFAGLDYESCDYLVLPLLLLTPTSKFSLDCKGQRYMQNLKKWNCSDPFDSDF